MGTSNGKRNDDHLERPIPGNPSVVRCKYCGHLSGGPLSPRDLAALAAETPSREQTPDVIEATRLHEQAYAERLKAENRYAQLAAARAPEPALDEARGAMELATEVAHRLYLKMQTAVARDARAKEAAARKAASAEAAKLRAKMPPRSRPWSERVAEAVAGFGAKSE